MTPTSDERREVAERLRAQARTVSHDSGYLWNRLEIAVNGWRVERSVDESYVFDNDVLSRLADLIDPTCHVVPFDEESMRLPHCSRCGQPMLKPWPNHCPNCGARCVDNGGTNARAD